MAIQLSGVYVHGKDTTGIAAQPPWLKQILKKKNKTTEGEKLKMGLKKV